MPAKLRIHDWKPEMTILGLGIALAAMIFSYNPPPSGPEGWDRALLVLLTISSGWFMIAGALHRVAAADTDERWDDRYDRLRDMTEAARPWLDNRFAPLAARMIDGESPWRNDWRDYVPHIPVPKPDERPLHAWDQFLLNHENTNIRQFYEFAKTSAQDGDISSYRRFAVRTYHRFGRLLAADVPGFRQWLEDEGVMDGAEPLLVLLAYLEIGRAAREPTNYPGDGHAGFWFLAHEWHHTTLQLRGGE